MSEHIILLVVATINVIFASGQIKVRVDPLTSAVKTLHRVPFELGDDVLQLEPFANPDVEWQDVSFN